MTVTPNHRPLSREHLAEAHVLADAGEHDLARDRLLAAARHALQALASSGADGVRDDQLALAVPSGGAPALPVDPAEELVPRDELDAGFERVQGLIDAVLAHPPAPARPTLPLYGGAAGALNARGAEAAARALARIRAALAR